MGLLGSENAEAGPVSRAAREAAEHLDMSHAARMQRAREQGFDVDTPVYHGTDVDFDEFDPDRAIGTQFWSTTDRASVENGEVGAAGQGVIKEMYSNIQNPAGWEEYDKFGIGELIARGYDGVKLPDGNGGFTINAFSPNQYRSVNAAFDPAKKDSANLLAQAVPAGIGLGLLGMTPETAQADTGLSQRADAPDNPFLHTLGMGVGRFNRNLSRKGLGLLSLDGLEDYLMKGAYSPEDLNYGDRLKAALDVAP